MATVAVTVTVPALAGVNLPFTIAATPVVPASFTVQTIVLLSASAGSTAAAPRSTSAPATAPVGVPAMFATGTNAAAMLMAKSWT